MIRSALANDWTQAHVLDRRYARLIDANFWDSNPTPVKTLLSLMGRISDHVRLPLVPPSAATRGRLERLAESSGCCNQPPSGVRFCLIRSVSRLTAYVLTQGH